MRHGLQSDREGLSLLKAMLRKADERSVGRHWNDIGELVEKFQPDE